MVRQKSGFVPEMDRESGVFSTGKLWCGVRGLNPDLYRPELFRKIPSNNAQTAFENLWCTGLNLGLNPVFLHKPRIRLRVPLSVVEEISR